MKIQFLRFTTTKEPTILSGIRMALFLFFTVVFTQISTAQNDLLSMDLIDSVESVREIQYSASDGLGVARGQIISSDRFISFNPGGNMIETLVYRKGRLFSPSCMNTTKTDEIPDTKNLMLKTGFTWS